MPARTLIALAVALLVSPAIADPAKDVKQLAKSNNQFALDLYAQLAGEQGDLFFSPYSIESALTMTLAGAKGQTAGQMYTALRLPGEMSVDGRGGAPVRVEPGVSVAYTVWPADRVHAAAGQLAEAMEGTADHESITLAIANSIWPAHNFAMKDDFVATLKKHYGVGVTPVAYPEPGRSKINAWVEKRTNDRIKDLLSPDAVSGQTRLVLVNAIYFKGDWQHPFKPHATRDRAFHLTAEKSVDVPTMFQRGTFNYLEDERGKLIELPYQGGDLSMVVMLPPEGEAVSKIVEDLDAASLDKRLAAAMARPVMLYLPKFKMTYAKALNQPLQAHGMMLAFTPDADFSGMSDESKLFISLVQHQAFVAVDEQGSEAAAATAVVMERLSAMPAERAVEFRADRPFLLAIRDRATGAILFMGRLTDPR